MLVARSTAHTALQRRHEVVLTAVTVCGGGACSLWPPVLFVPAVLLIVLRIPAATVDAVEHRIPNRLSMPLAVSMLVALTCSDDPSRLQRVLAGAAVWSGLLLATFLATGQPGPGDVKLAPGPGPGMLAIWRRWSTLATTIVAAYLLAALVGLAGLARRKLSRRAGRLPLAPPMVAATIGIVTVFSCIRS
ncbi:A24 family peptidase [Amycolatopsis sp. NPDC050768]|uniref:A24 family peptidase n=1 Tax=Amycolatopsis sp. NPDC050768 TaxID=3154839 RepID=UPI0033C608DB